MWDQANRRIVSKPVMLSNGLVALAEYAVIPNRPCIRFLVSFQNPTNSSVDFVLEMGSEVGSDDMTQLEAKSSDEPGDDFGPNDRWVITDDDGNYNDPSDPVITHVFYGQ